MFAYHLSFDEKRALLKLVGYLAVSDQEVTEQERSFVVNLAHDLKVPSDGVFGHFDDHTLENLCAPFERESAKRVVLVELVDLALSEREEFAQEKAAVRKIAGLMGVADSEVAAIEAWVQRGQQWHEQGRELLGLEEGQKMDV